MPTSGHSNGRQNCIWFVDSDPGEHEAQWNEAGVKTYIYVGCDVLATLEAAHDIVSKP